MNYAQFIERRDVRARPTQYSEYLAHYVADDPERANDSYEGWELDHGADRRFFVGGMQWFRRTTGLSAKDLEAFTDAATAEASKSPGVVGMPNSGNRWQELSRNQIKAAREKEPMFFQKAVLTILACELAITDIIDRGGKKASKELGIADPSEVHRHMAVIPAVWNIDDFGRTFENLQREGHGGVSKVLAASGQRSLDVLEGLAIGKKGKGNTVTFETAKRIHDALKVSFPAIYVGQVRASPGRFLGRGSAMAEEVAEVG